ncbi:hypothetical protein AVEN_74886-1 [Araneus ventricosus]|uniref:SCAN domain-containing protein n=1 Tax=Araneus ventricosus TaxID=182803 RepID=A0A4Y2RLB4_ARAVE|nr:hypothetical protein AVEN_74886-1 [Araneus ventricosus]
MGSRSNLTQENIPLSPASTESPIEIQEFIDSNLKLPYTQLIEDTVMKNIQCYPAPPRNHLCMLKKSSLSYPQLQQNRHHSFVKRTIQGMVSILCSKAESGAHKCKSCDMFVHVICGQIDPKEEGYGKNVLCSICKKNMNQKIQRDEATKGLEKPVKKMLAVSNAKHPNVDEGVAVIIKVPEADRAKTDARFILAAVLSKTEDGFYKLGTKTGILKQLYAKS